MIELQPISPLGSSTPPQPFIAAEFELSELPQVTKIRVQALRSRGASTPCVDPRRLPTTPNTSLGLDPTALWRAPDDWLIYSSTLAADQISDSLSDIASEAPLIATDVSSASVVLELLGPRSLDVLMRDCTLDLEGGAIPPGHCAQTTFAQVSILIHRPAKGDAWRLFIERSVAQHVWEWLADSCQQKLY